MGTLKSWRRAYGALKDSTKVTIVQINSDYAELDVAIIRATNHVEVPPKDRHLRKILVATSAIRPRADVAYCIHALSRRLSKTRNWTVALKTLIVIHRLLRDGDPSFREELLNFSQRNRVLQLSNFKDDSSLVAWDCSAFVRIYALYLEERLECSRILKHDIEAERLPKLVQGQEKGYSKIRELCSEDLLEQLPALQQLLDRLVGCQPEGAAVTNRVIQCALTLVLKESFKLFCSVNDGIVNLVDKFFEMPRHQATKALDIYKRAGQQACSLSDWSHQFVKKFWFPVLGKTCSFSDYHEVCKGVELTRNFQFPGLREPPFLVTMEEHIRDSVASEPLLQLTYRPEKGPSEPEDAEIPGDEAEPAPSDNVAASQDNNIGTVDLLGLDFDNTADALEEKNATLALAIVSTEPDSAPKDFDPIGWELALVTTPSTNLSAPTDRQLAGGLDSLTLNSLYDQAASRLALQQPVYGSPAPNPFEVHDPFAVSTSIAQTGMMAQQPVDPFGGYPPANQQHMMMGAPNPFGDTTGFGTFPVNPVDQTHANNNNLFGSTGICNYTWRLQIA